MYKCYEPKITPCVHSFSLRTKIRIGEHEIKNEMYATKDCTGYYGDTCNEGHQDFDIENVLIHPGYKGKRNFFKNDIALIRLKTKVKMNGKSL